MNTSTTDRPSDGKMKHVRKDLLDNGCPQERYVCLVAKNNPSLHARNYITIVSGLYLLVVAFSLYLNLVAIDRRYTELATSVARSVFQQLVTLRNWSSQHGGIYLETGKDLRLDPAVAEALDRVKTVDGRVLTRIHPEYLMKLMSVALAHESGITVNLTSLKLTSMDSEADPWEREALHKFDEGVNEQFAFSGKNQSVLFRYIAPLKTEESCLACHGKQGYRIGDTRGALSVSFSYAPFQKASARGKAQTSAAHLVFALTGLAILLFLGKKLIKRIVELQEASTHIKRLEGMLPICAGCKKIRTAGADPKKQESWIPIEVFIRDKTDAEFSHGFCPECLKRLYGWDPEG